MSRITGAGMTFKGITSTSMGVQVVAFPSIPRAKQRGDMTPVAGRSGGLWIPDGGYETVTLQVKLRLTPSANRAKVSAWLTGSGDLSFSNDPTHFWKAVAQDEYAYEPFVPGRQMDVFTAVFLCQPYRYITPVNTFEYPSSPASLANAGTAEAEPVITVTGTGDFTLTVGGVTFTFSDITEAITIDVPKRLAYNGMVNLCGNMSNDDGLWPILGTGTNTISWEGDITKVAVTPNWRDL